MDPSAQIDDNATRQRDRLAARLTTPRTILGLIRVALRVAVAISALLLVLFAVVFCLWWGPWYGAPLTVPFYLAFAVSRLVSESPWVGSPILAFVGFELACVLLRNHPVRARLKAAIDDRAGSVLAALFVATCVYAAVSIYAHRSGPADIGVLNRSSTTCRDVSLLVGEKRLPLGDLLPFERRNLFMPLDRHQVPITMTFTVDGETRSLDFRTVDDSRRYFVELSISPELSSEFGAWRLRDRPALAEFLVRNEGSATLRNVIVSGLGFIHPIPAILPGENVSFSMRPKGPSAIALEYEVDGVRYAEELHRGWVGAGLRRVIRVESPGRNHIDFR